MNNASRIERIKTKFFDDDQLSTVTVAGNVIELKTMEHRNDRQNTRLLDRDHWINENTGEIGSIVHRETRADDQKQLRRTFRYLRALINANSADPRFIRFITLTYADNMTDPKRLYEDFEKFNARFQRWLSKERYGKAEYISVVEPQARGAWHCHVLYFFDQAAPFIPRDELEALWGHGFVHVRAVDSCDNIGAYLTAYLADIEVPSGAERLTEGVLEKEVNGQSKRFIKGGRLSMYPAGMRIFRCSRFIKRPTITTMTYGEAKALVSGLRPVYDRTVHIVDEESGWENTIRTEQFNRKREEIFHLTPEQRKPCNANFQDEIEEDNYEKIFYSTDMESKNE